MKSLIVTLLATSLFTAPLWANDQPAPAGGCAAKQQHISQQIEQAKATGNSAKQAGLQTALKAVQEHCTDSSRLREQEDKALKAKQEVSQREADLKKALGTGDAQKVDKRKEKLATSRKELEDAQTQLEHLNDTPDDSDD